MGLMAQVDRARSTLQSANEQLSEARELLGKPKQEAPKEPEEKGFFGKLKDTVSNVSLSDVGHTVLDFAGLVPVLGAPADGINAVWYAAEGDWVNAGLSATGMIPIAGEAATVAKLGNRAVDAVSAMNRSTDAVRDVGRSVEVAAEAPPQRILFGQRRISETFSTTQHVPESLAGRRIEDVARDLRDGRLSSDEIQISAFRYQDQWVSANSRGLAALSEAGLHPTNVREIPPDENLLGRLMEPPLRHDAPLPGPTTFVTPSQTNLNILREINLPD